MEQIDYQNDNISNLLRLKNVEGPILVRSKVLADLVLLAGFQGAEGKPQILKWMLDNRPQDFIRMGNPTIIKLQNS